MAVTITAYQGLGGAFRLDRPGESTKQILWKPSPDMIRDNSQDNKAVLIFKFEPMGANGLDLSLFSVNLNDQSLSLERFRVDGATRSMVVAMLSNKWGVGNNSIINIPLTFQLTAGEGGVFISDHVIFYKRTVEGV